MAQHDYVIGNDDGASVRADINNMAAAVKSNNSDASTFPASAVQGMSFTQNLSATQQLEWKYDGAAWRLIGIVDPTNGGFYHSKVRAISGLTLSNNGSDATNDIDIAAGWTAADGAEGTPLILLSALTGRLDGGTWVVGTNQPKLDTGSIANTTYHVWLIRRSDTGVVDVLFSTSASSPTMPANYDQKRLIGSIIRVSGAIKLFTQIGDEFLLNVGTDDIVNASPGTSANLGTLTVPSGRKVTAIFRAYVNNASSAAVLVTSPDQTDQAPDTSVHFSVITIGSSDAGMSECRRRTNTSAQIRYRSTAATLTIFRVLTLGWIDRRGQDAA